MSELEKLKILKTEEQGFIRKGNIGKNNEWTEELNEKINKWIETHMKTTDLKFPIYFKK